MIVAELGPYPGQMRTAASYAILVLLLASCGGEPAQPTTPPPEREQPQEAPPGAYAGQDIAYWIAQLRGQDTQSPANEILSAIGPPAVSALLAAAKNKEAGELERARAVGILGNIGIKFPRTAARIHPELVAIAESDAGHFSGTAEYAAKQMRDEADGTASPDAADWFWRRNESWDAWWERNRDRITRKLQAVK